ncbi:hypothetical protein Gpo141_00012350, partial [Globisporangium polare]
MGTNASSETPSEEKTQQQQPKTTVEEHVETATDEHGTTTVTTTTTTTTVSADGTVTTSTTVEQDIQGVEEIEVLEEISTDEEVTVTESEERYVSVSASSAARGVAAAEAAANAATGGVTTTSNENEEEDDEEILTVATTVTDFESVSEEASEVTTTKTMTTTSVSTEEEDQKENEKKSVSVTTAASSSEPESEPSVYFESASTTATRESDVMNVIVNGGEEDEGLTVRTETFQAMSESGELIETIVTTTTTSTTDVETATTTTSAASSLATTRWNSLTVYGTTRKSFKKWLYQFILYVTARGQRFETMTIVDLFVFARSYCHYYLLERREDWRVGSESKLTKAHVGAWEMARALTLFTPVVPLRQRLLRATGKDTVILDEIMVQSAEISDYISIHRRISKWLQKVIVISLIQESTEEELVAYGGRKKETAVILHDGELIFSGTWDQVVTFVQRIGFECPPRRDVANLLLGFESGKLDYSYGSIVEHVKRYETRRSRKFAVLFRLADDVVLMSGAPSLPAFAEGEEEEYSTRLQIVDGGSFWTRSRRSVSKRTVRTGSSRRSKRSQHGEAEYEVDEEMWVRHGKSKSEVAASRSSTQTERQSRVKKARDSKASSASSSPSSSSLSSSSSSGSDSLDNGARKHGKWVQRKSRTKQSGKANSNDSDDSNSSGSDQGWSRRSKKSSSHKSKSAHFASGGDHAASTGEHDQIGSIASRQSGGRHSASTSSTSTATGHSAATVGMGLASVTNASGSGAISVTGGVSSSTEYEYDTGSVSVTS